MRSTKQLQRLAKTLALMCFSEGHINEEKIHVIYTTLREGNSERIGIKVARTELLPVLRFFIQEIKTAIRAEMLTVTTSFPLQNEKKRTLADRLTQMYNKNTIHFLTDSHITGGIRIQNGWDVIDQTIAQKFHTLTR